MRAAVSPVPGGRCLMRSRLLWLAAAYNAAWGLVAIAAPRRLAQWLGFDAAGDGMGWRAAGVVVLAYAPAYLWASEHSAGARPILATAITGKSIGALGWLLGLASGRFPKRTILLPLANDLMWLPGLARLALAPRPTTPPLSPA